MWLLLLFLAVVAVAAALVRATIDAANAAAHPTPVLSLSLSDAEASSVSLRTFDAKDVAAIFSVVIPCYNEEKRITRTLQATKDYFDRLVDSTGQTLPYEVIVMDDGSRDATVKTVEDFVRYAAPRKGSFRIFRLLWNSGKGVAVKEGLLRSCGALCLFLDADGATEIESLQGLREQLLQLVNLGRLQNVDAERYKQLAGRHAVVVGSRAHLQDKVTAERAFYRTVLMHGFHLLVWLVTWTKVRDTQCGFKLFTRAAVAEIFPHLKIGRWCFDVEVLLLAQKNRIPIGEVPVIWREVPGSKVRFYHVLHMAWELGIIFVGYTFFPSWKTWKGQTRTHVL